MLKQQAQGVFLPAGGDGSVLMCSQDSRLGLVINSSIFTFLSIEVPFWSTVSR